MPQNAKLDHIVKYLDSIHLENTAPVPKYPDLATISDAFLGTRFSSRTNAYHEAGHALAIFNSPYHSLRELSIISHFDKEEMSFSGGYAKHYCHEPNDINAIFHGLKILFAGYAAEEYVRGKPRAAVEGDFQHAHEEAQDFAFLPSNDAPLSTAFNIPHVKSGHPAFIYHEAKYAAMAQARTLISANTGELHAVAKALRARKTLTRHQVNEILTNFRDVEIHPPDFETPPLFKACGRKAYARRLIGKPILHEPVTE